MIAGENAPKYIRRKLEVPTCNTATNAISAATESEGNDRLSASGHATDCAASVSVQQVRLGCDAAPAVTSLWPLCMRMISVNAAWAVPVCGRTAIFCRMIFPC